ncbi:TPA: hypothetical protein N0F65_010819 [Lagenidium giganteum]|uniref:Uncharacterized protein n=1 Tax=Lagenidium giganteum TaxID=4803 RepID=A0AAV2Z723_9STRA|nr:TPA: hypothetical protein N0F65_010819 [Lagenidium giganteum]
MDDTVQVEVPVVMRLRPRRHALTVLCPGLSGREDIIARILAQQIEIPGKFNFMFDDGGVVTYFVGEFNLPQGLLDAVGSLQDVMVCLDSAKLQTTGRIDYCEGEERLDTVAIV